MIKDNNLIIIKEVVKSISPDARIILFGSRGRGDFESFSDYDLLVVVKQVLTIKEKRQYAGMIANYLGKMEVPADVIVKTEEDVIYYQDKIGSITREAILEGVSLC